MTFLWIPPLRALSHTGAGIATQYIREIKQCLTRDNYGDLVKAFNGLLLEIPYDLFTDTERYYQSLFYLTLTLTGISLQAETHTHRGRIDIVIEHQERVWIIEYKRDQTAQIAIEQIEGRATIPNISPEASRSAS